MKLSQNKNTKDYVTLFSEIRQQIKDYEIETAMLADSQMLYMYWHIGNNILIMQEEHRWGTKMIDLLAKYLKNEFPDQNSFSVRNLKYMQEFAEKYPMDVLQRLAAPKLNNQIHVQLKTLFTQTALAQISWQHHIALMDKIEDIQERLWYINEIIKNRWNEDTLVAQIKTNLYKCKATEEQLPSKNNIPDSVATKDISEPDEFVKIVERYKKRFIYLAYSYIGDFEISEDIVMDSFIAYLEKEKTLNENINIPAYILTVIKNKCINHLNHQKIKSRSLNEIQEHAQWKLSLKISTLEACDPYEIFSDEVKSIIDQTLQLLPAKTLEIFKLSREEGKTNKEVAETLNISIKVVEYHISKALTAFRFNLKDYLCESSIIWILMLL